MSVDICKGCGELQSNVPVNVLFHPFPIDREKHALWEKRCQEGGLFDQSSQELAEGQKWTVCSRHFKKDDYITVNDDIHILKPSATPSIFRKSSGDPHNIPKDAIVVSPELTSMTQHVKVLTGTQPIIAGGKKCQVKVTQITERDRNYYKPFAKVSDAHNWRNRCRVCGKLWSSSILCNIFGDKANKANIARKINTCLPLKVLSNDEFPLKICKHCVQKIDDFVAFKEASKAADAEFHDEQTRFKLVKALESQESLIKEAINKQKQQREGETSTQTATVANVQIEVLQEEEVGGEEIAEASPSTRKRKRKENPAGAVVEPLKRVKIFRLHGAKAKKARGEIIAPVEVKVEAIDESDGGGSGGDNDLRDSGSDIELKLEDSGDEEETRAREGTKRFNLRTAPKPNVIFASMGFPAELKKTQRSPGPTILRKIAVESPELRELIPPDLPAELNTAKVPKKRESRLKGRKPRSKRYFVTRKTYGDRIINQKCNTNGCEVVCETVHKFLQHKYLQHDESNYSFCRVCSQVYETKPRNVDNGHRHLPEPGSLPVLSFIPKGNISFNCDECNKDFIDRAKLIQHNKSKHGSYHCSECSKKFNVLYEFKKHIQDHIFTKGGLPHRIMKKKSKNKYICEICKESTDNFMQLNVHTMKNHDQDFQFLPCDCCSSVFYTDQLLRLHKELKSSEEIQLCENCGSTFATANELRGHKKICFTATTKPMACKHCNIFVHPNKMVTHMNWHISQEEPERCQKCLLPRWSSHKHNCKFYRCDACQLSFNGYPKFLEHKRTHVSKDAKYFCNICDDAKFSSFEDLVEHFKEHTPDELKRSRLKYISTMPLHKICQEPNCLEVLHKNVVRKHRNNKHCRKIPPKMTPEEVLTCPLCNEVQPGVSEYIQHRLDHNKVYELPCSHCHLKFDGETRRTIHIMRCHTEASRVSCDICQRVFNSMQKLRVHMMRHLKYKPYVCRHPGCKASYYLFGDWRKHSMLHVGMNPNICKPCNKQFMKAETLVAHNKKWHPDENDLSRAEEEEEKEEEEADIIYQCSKCSFRDRVEMVVIEHLERDHLKEEEESCEKVLLELGASEGGW